MTTDTNPVDRDDAEVGALVEAVSKRGELSKRDLAAAVDARSWGPRRFERALDLGLLGGRIRRTSSDRFAAPDDF